MWEDMATKAIAWLQTAWPLDTSIGAAVIAVMQLL
jgi:hypothetical protein